MTESVPDYELQHVMRDVERLYQDVRKILADQRPEDAPPPEGVVGLLDIEKAFYERGVWVKARLLGSGRVSIERRFLHKVGVRVVRVAEHGGGT